MWTEGKKFRLMLACSYKRKGIHPSGSEREVALQVWKSSEVLSMENKKATDLEKYMKTLECKCYFK